MTRSILTARSWSSCGISRSRLEGVRALRELQAFEAHPESNFSVGGVYTRRSPYPSFQILSRRLLKNGSDSLLGSSYYEHFTPDMLRAVGMPRP